MRTISILNVKGGVSKTTTAIAFAYLLATKYNKKVLLVDLDKQANTTKSFDCYDSKADSISELLIDSECDIRGVIKKTKYENIDVIPADLRLMEASQKVLLDVMGGQQQLRIAEHFQKGEVDSLYDFCIMDCPTDINISTLNALCVTDDVIVPILIDAYSLEGMEYVFKAINSMKKYNMKLNLCGSFVSMYSKNNVNSQGFELIKNESTFKSFKTCIRHTTKVRESTFEKKPVNEYAKNSTASKDYEELVKEYLKRIDYKII